MVPNVTSPRNKIALLEKDGHIVRLKRGLYVVAPSVSGVILSRELIANHIYGPSYVSMESALRFYELIPESVYGVRSMTVKRSRNFENVLAHFSYIQCSFGYFTIGINQVQKANNSFLIATPEKALCDLIAYTPKLNPQSLYSMRSFLEEDLRLDMEQFYEMDEGVFRECAKVSKKSAALNNIIKLIENESIR